MSPPTLGYCFQTQHAAMCTVGVNNDLRILPEYLGVFLIVEVRSRILKRRRSCEMHRRGPRLRAGWCPIGGMNLVIGLPARAGAAEKTQANLI